MGLSGNLIRARFEANVHIVPFSTCHYWGGAINDAGYGMLDVNGKWVRAHRVSYEIHKGAIPEINGNPALLRHVCDTPLCVNSDHLIPGTQADNMRDAAERGRMPSGERHHKCRVSDADLATIMVDIAAGGRATELAEKYGVSASFIATLRHGGGRSRGGEKPTGRSDRQISDQKALAIYAAIRSGARTGREVAEIFGVSATMVSDIKRGRTYASVTGHGRR